MTVVFRYTCMDTYGKLKRLMHCLQE